MKFIDACCVVLLAMAPLAAQAEEAQATPVAEAVVPVANAAEAEVVKMVGDWAQAWAANDLSAYMAAYASDFTPGRGMSKAKWEKQRSKRVAKRKDIKVDVSDMQVQLVDEKHAVAKFKQAYVAKSYRDNSQKTLSLVKVDDRWLIAKEESVKCGARNQACQAGEAQPMKVAKVNAKSKAKAKRKAAKQKA